MIGLCLSLSLISLIISVLLTRILLRVSHRLDMLDRAGSELHKGHDGAVPNTGGMAVFWAVVGPITGIIIAVWVLPEEGWQRLLPPLAIHIDGLRQVTAQAIGVVVALAAIHTIGLLDDRRGLGPFIKLLGQVLVAGGLVIWCDMRILSMLGNVDSAWGGAGYVLSITISIAWLVTITNAFNFLDNMDGLAGGVAAIIAAVYLVATLLSGQWFIAATAALLLGGLVGFLIFNFPPARIFMGDGGSLVVGLLAAMISIQTTYYHTDEPIPGRYWYGLLMPVLVMAIPLYDCISVTIIRLMHGRSPFIGDHNHFSHRLVRKGMTRPQAVVVIWLCTAATALSGVMLGSLQTWQAIIVTAQTVTILLILALLERDSAR